MSLVKPVMRGMLQRRLRIHVCLAFATCVGCVVGFKLLVSEPRKRAYADFYKQYDANKDFIHMKEAGVFQSVKPSGE